MTSAMTRAPLSVTAEKPDQPYLSFNNVGQVFNTQRGPFEALKEINLEVDQGEFVCVIGHSGCGKSTPVSYTHLTLPTILRV